MDMYSVVVSGAIGKMGQEIARTVLSQPDMELVGAIGHSRHLGEDIGEIVTGEPCGVMVSTNVDEVMERARGGVLVDVSTGSAVKNIVAKAIEYNVACIIGTSGISKADEEEILAMAKAKMHPVLFAPNFALGAVLMMKFCKEASRYFRWVEIIEKHHERKLDAPSGTAKRTAELMLRAREGGFRSPAEGEETVKGARGGNVSGIHIHSVRMPGYLASQDVIFGSAGETLTISHDAGGRECFMAGVVLAIRKVRRCEGVVMGLENILDDDRSED